MEKSEELKKALAKAYVFIKFRPRSEKEVRERLKQKEVPSSIIQQAIEELYQFELLDDALFAKQWAEEKALSKHYGRSKVMQELMQKGINREIAAYTVEEVFGETDEAASAVALLESKYRQGLAEEDKKKAIHFLLRKGYSFSLANQAVKRFSSPEGH